MAKKKELKPQREVTKRHLSQWQRQRRRQRIVFGLGVLVIVVILGIVGAGWSVSWYRPLHYTVLRVKDTEFDMNYYVALLYFHAVRQLAQFNTILFYSV